ncbi:homeodomain-containing protein [Botrytis cinerea]
MNFQTPEQSYNQDTNPRETHSTMALLQRPHVFSGSDWRGLEPVEMRSKPRMANVGESLPSIRTMFSGFESHERPIESEYRHATSFSPITTERNTSPGSNKRMRLSENCYDEESQQQQERYQSVSSGRSPMTATYGYHSANSSPVSSNARRESRVHSSHGSPYISRSGREQPILSIPERRAQNQDHHTSRPPFHSPISEPSKSYRTTTRRIPPINEYPRNEYALEASRSYHQQKYAPSRSDYGYHQPRDQGYPQPATFPHHPGQTPFTNRHHSGNYNPAPYQSQDMGDAKPRKRRGNLPKPTTDILTTWFINHLEHPYPNEEEKQLLMRQTNLQLNQISNWFINARRRKLPALQNSARAENAARSHHNRMHSADGGQSPMSLCNSEPGLSPRAASAFNEGWPSRQEERHSQEHY